MLRDHMVDNQGVRSQVWDGMTTCSYARVQKRNLSALLPPFVMAALCNRGDALYFCHVVSFYLLSIYLSSIYLSIFFLFFLA